MVLQLIFLFGLYPVLFILYFCMKFAVDAKDGDCFGARLQKEWASEEAVERIITEYKRELKRYTMILALIPIVTFFVPHFSINFTIWMIWLLAVIVCTQIPFARANTKIKALKKEWGVGMEQSKRTELLAEMKSAGEVRKVRFSSFFLPILLSVAAGVFSIFDSREKDILIVGGVVASFALITVMLYGVAVWMDRQKVEVISSNSDVNVNYARAKKQLWKNMWLVVAWLNTLFTIFAAAIYGIFDFVVGVLLWGSILYTLLTLGIMVWCFVKIRKLDASYEEQRDIVAADDDDMWIWGMFYYNKSDRHTMVNKRVGVGTTINMATTAGKVYTLIGLAGLLVIPFCCIWVIMEEFTPMKLALQDDVLRAEHLKVEYEIPVSEIEEFALIDEIPAWSKVNGTGMDNLDKGTFHIRNEGNCEVFLNPQNAFFIQIETAEETYYMSASEDEETLAVFEELKK